MGCQGDAEPRAGRAGQGGLNDIVGLQFRELIIAAFFRLPCAPHNIQHNFLYGWSKSSLKCATNTLGDECRRR